ISGYIVSSCNVSRRQYRASDHRAAAQIFQRLLCLIERPPGDRDRRHRFTPHQVEQCLELGEAADVAALDGRGLDRDQRQRPRRRSAEQADDDELAASRQAIEAERTRLRAADEIDCRASGAATSTAAMAPASSAACRLRASMSTTMAPFPPIALSSPSAINPSPPAPMIRTGSRSSTSATLRNAL